MNAGGFTVLINCSPQIMLLAVDCREHLVNKESIAITTVLSLQSSNVYSSEFYAPQPDGFVTERATTISEKIFDISMAEVESIVEPSGVADDFGLESMTFVYIHRPILSNLTSLFVSTVCRKY